ncbi:hypothetical protein ACWEEU_27885, partial [Streptomyces sp. NPDC005004]
YSLPGLLATMGAQLSGPLRPPAGPWRQTWNLRIPETVPLARHRIHLRARTAYGEDFMALEIPVDFTRRRHFSVTYNNTHHTAQNPTP